MKKETEKRIIEAIVIGAMAGIIMLIALNIFIKQECMCYDDYGKRYHTKLYKFKKLPCDEQCIFFGEREGVELTDVEPEKFRDWLEIRNWSLEVIE